MARSCGPEMSALAPLLGDNQTSGERVRIDAIDPNVWSGRAVQEVSSIWQYGLASMYPVSPWSSFAPDHHGYQRARDVITGQASTGPFGSPVFACAGKTDPPLLVSSSRRPRRVDYIINSSSFFMAVPLFAPDGRSFVPACACRRVAHRGRQGWPSRLSCLSRPPAARPRLDGPEHGAREA